jgi:hypothetical protein
MPKKCFTGATNQSRSTVQLGNEAQHGSSAGWGSQTKADFDPRVARSGDPYRRVKKDPNASHVRFARDGATPRNYDSVTREEFGPATSVHASTYTRAAPAPGFDRQTANQTNYELGETPTHYVTANELSTLNPRDQPSPGGPTFPTLASRDYNPNNCAGYKHNLVTGKNDPYASYRPLPDRFKSNDKDLYGTLVGRPREGQTRHYDLTVGRTRENPKMPPKPLDEAREPPLDSVAALRPPLPGDIDIRAASRRRR